MSWMSSALVDISWMLFFTLAVCVLAFLALMLGEMGLSSRGPREPLAV
jgi:hypothetical protein